MLSIARVGANLEYYLELATLEYYLSGGEPPGRWHGQGAARLGLKGLVATDEFRALAAGFDRTGQHKLVQNAGKPNRQVGWDLTFSTPKSVSVLWAAGSPQKRALIQLCQRLAVQKGIDYLEREAGRSRVGQGGRETTPSGLVAGLFEHGTSRAGDPQLHTHALILNLGVDEHGQTRSIVSKPFYELKMAAGAVYRLELAHQLVQRLGVRLEPDRFSFKVKGVPEPLCQMYSQRRQEIERALQKADQSSAVAAQIATLETRRRKDVVPRQQLFQVWEQECRQWGLTPQRVDALCGHQPVRRRAPQAVDSAFRGLAAQHSHFSSADLLRDAATLAQPQGVSADQMQRVLDDYLHNSPQAVPLPEERYTSAKNLEQENELLAAADRMTHDHRHQVPIRTLEKHLLKNSRQSLLPPSKRRHVHALTWEQSAALAHITVNEGAIQVVSGKAGVGKTEMLNMARQIWEASGLKVYGACLAGKAARGLEQATGIQSVTVAKFLYDSHRPLTSSLRHHVRQLARAARKKRTWKYEPAFRLDRNSVLVLDEAAMIGTQDLNALLQDAERAGAKIVLIGDADQLQPIAPGSPFRALSERLGQVQIEEIKRQRDPFDRQAVADLSNGQVQSAIENLHDRGLVHVADTRQAAVDQLLSDWNAARRREDPILVSTRAEAADVNRACQSLRRQQHELSRWHYFTVDRQRFHVGDRIQFLKGNRIIGVDNGDYATIKKVNVHRQLMLAQRDDGTRVVVPFKQYREFSLGYATTTHKGQGMTVENAFVLLGGPMQDGHLAYVQMSRARGKTRVYLARRDAGPEFRNIISRMRRKDDRRLARDLLDQQRIEEEQARPASSLCLQQSGL